MVAALAALWGSVNHDNQADASTTSAAKKTLIIYFSLRGSTKEAAQYIQKQTGADIIRIYPEDRYKGYDDASQRGEREMKNNIHPALATKLPNLDKYDTILLGYPTWWSRPPMLFWTLFDDYDFKGKTIIPFTTSMSTPIKDSQKYVKRLATADGANFKSGIRYDDNKAQVRQWLKKLGLINWRGANMETVTYQSSYQGRDYQKQAQVLLPANY